MAAADELTAAMATHLAADRRQAVHGGHWLPDREQGCVLFADIGGFTTLTEAMDAKLGAQRGAESLAMCVHRVFDTLVDAVERHHGSIVGFAGDAMTCWFGPGRERAAVACALAMQEAMRDAGQITVPEFGAVTLTLKVSVGGGQARRFIVGDPEAQLLDVLAGPAADCAGDGEKHCRRGEVVVDGETAARLRGAVEFSEVRGGYVVAERLREPVAEDPWPAPESTQLDENAVRPWMPPPVYERIRAGQARFLAEFRPVVAMFVSFGGIDYEADGAEADLNAFIRQAQATVADNGGSVFDVSMGDKGSYLLAVFGAPTATGSEARGAATAADELRRSGGEGVQIGVAIGRVFAGLYSGRFRSAYSILGDVVNVAARLMTNAGAGQVLMSGRAGAALDRRFAIRALQPIAVKGRSAPVAVCELLGTTSPDVSLSEPRYPLPLVGREQELEVIDAALAQAAAGSGGVLAFAGEAGMGKSRLVNAAIHRAGDTGFTVAGGECQPHGTRIAYLPWQPVWNALLSIPLQADDGERRAALLAVLEASAPEAVPLAPLLSTVLGLPMEDTDATRGMPAPVRKQLLEQLLCGALRARAGIGPLCIVLEDLHWADSLSRDLLSALAGASQDVPVLLVLAYRPPDGQPTPALPGARELRLGELSEGEANQLAALLLTHFTREEADPATVAIVTQRANGNPFYLEELVREIRERGGSTDDLPTTLESLILGRIDRMTPAQQLTARVASVIGRRIPTEWLIGAYATELDSQRVPRDLIDLSSAGLIVADTPPPEEAYVFRHAIVRDVAYETLAYRLRQTLHEELGDYLEQRSESPPVDLLAYHYARSENTAKEAIYRRLAAEVAIRNGAYPDALAHVERASEIVREQPDGPDRLEQELELALLLGSILLVTDGQGSAKAKAVYDGAHELCKELPPGPAVGRAVFGLWTYYLFQGLMPPTAELADEAVRLGQISEDPGVQIMAHLAVAQTHMWTGEWRKCVEHYDEVVGLYDPALHQVYITQYAQNPRFTASNSAFWGQWMLGYPEQADRVAEEAIEEARQLRHDFTYTIAFLGRPLVAWFRGHDEGLIDSVGEYVASAQRAGNPFYIALSLSLDASAKVLQGDSTAGLQQLEQQYATMHAIGSKLCDPLIISLLAEAYLSVGRYEDGLALLERTVPEFERDGRLSFMPDHLRLQAELLEAQRPESADAREQARTLLRRAVAIARDHGARSLELRAALALARRAGIDGAGSEARDLLARAYADFTEGLDDPDQREAREMLSHPIGVSER